MVNLISKLKDWSTDYLQGSDEFLVDIENKPGSSKYRVVVDGIESITIKRCAMLSRYLSKQMDEDESIDEDDYFTFEVSSPGADRPLEVETLDGEKSTGSLISVDEDKISIEVEVSKKETAAKDIEFKNIKEANVIISFK